MWKWCSLINTDVLLAFSEMWDIS